MLAYVTQAAVGSYGWLTQAQQSTARPRRDDARPLIMVLQFIGFMAGGIPGRLNQTTSAIVGTCDDLHNFSALLPFIFIGAQHRSLRGIRGDSRAVGRTAA